MRLITILNCFGNETQLMHINSSQRIMRYGFTAFAIWATMSSASAHFIWLAPGGAVSSDTQSPAAEVSASGKVEIYFGESATPDNPRLLDLLAEIKVQQLSDDKAPRPLQVTRSGDSLSAQLLDFDKQAGTVPVVVASQDFGVRDKGGEKFRLMYYAKSGPPVTAPQWTKIDAAPAIDFDVVPKLADGKVELQLTFKGSPAAESEIVVVGPEGSDEEGSTGQSDADGKYAFSASQVGRYSIRARHVETAAGSVNDRNYDAIRHYVTLTLDVPSAAVPVKSKVIGELPTTLTSFGGAVLDGFVYVYGGTKGSSHQYASELQNDALMRMPVGGGQWETIARGPHLQGLALVPHGGKLYRIGGFEAKNKTDEEHDLWSVDTAACFDPATGKWTDLPSLPEPRSSFDAVVMDDHIYVVGGWAMSGDARKVWHETAWKLDLTQPSAQWTEIAKAPFERRALALAAHDGKLYAIGGISSGDETSLATDVYDPKSNTWKSGPELIGETGMTGFGASAFATGENLYITTVAGNLQRLSADGAQWMVVAQTPTGRFFHRMLPTSDDSFVMVGGSNMRGRITAVERFTVPK